MGLGQTGFAAVDTLCELGCEVTVVAAEASPDVEKLAGVVGARVVVDSVAHGRVAALDGVQWDLAVVSPGVSPGDAVMVHLAQENIPVWSDLDLAWRLRDKSGTPAEWIMVQHSAAMDITVDLAHRVFQVAEVLHRVAGYAAAPVLDALREPRTLDVLIINVSPQSLVWRSRFPASPISPLLTVSLEEEGDESGGVFFDGTVHACVYRKDVGPTEAQVQDAEVVDGARAVGLGLDSPGMSDIGLVEGIIVDRAFLDDRAHQALEISTLEEIQEAGWQVPQQLPSLLGAIAITRSRDIAPALIAGVLSLP